MADKNVSSDDLQIEDGDIVRTAGKPGPNNSGIHQWTDLDKLKRIQESRTDEA